MSPNERMNIGDWLPSNDGSACSSIRRLLVAGVDGLKTVQTLLEFRTQSVMRLDHIPESVDRSVNWSHLEKAELNVMERKGKHDTYSVSPPAVGPSRR